MEHSMLLQLAFAIRQNAYAPYSGFCVGAAIEAADGRIFSGCNVENGSYSMTICAERSAIFTAVSAGARQFRQIAIAGGKTSHDAKTQVCVPCGACLQVLSEFCAPEMPVILADGVHMLREFFPQAFRFG